MTDREAIVQALTVLKAWDALIKYQYGGSSEAMTAMQNVAWRTLDTIEGLEAALAQPEQDSLICWTQNDLNIYDRAYSAGKQAGIKQALAQGEQSKYSDIVSDGGLDPRNNFDAQPEQEPVAWITPDGEGFRMRLEPPVNDVPLGWKALYTAPPPKPWVGLTEWERNYYNNRLSGSGVAEDIEFELRSRNETIRTLQS